MMSGSLQDMGGMMWGMGAVSLLIILLLVFGLAALIKYLFFGNRRRNEDD